MRCLGRSFLVFSAVGFAFLSIPAHAETTSTAILKMADGNYYHPSTGFKNSDENALRVLLGLPVAASSEPVIGEERTKPAILLAVYRAQAELRARLVAAGLDKRTTMQPVGQDAARPVTLAVWNRVTDEIQYVDAVKKGMALDVDEAATVGIKVKLTNYINSDYATNNPDHIVVAVRYPIYHEVKKGKKVVSYDVEQAVYTPASAPLLTPEVVAEGERLLDLHISNGIVALHKEATISPGLIKAIAVIEHTDRSWLMRDAKAAAGKVYATLALNPDQPYGYSRSSAGALGLFQFIPSTYKNFAKRPGLALNQNFEAGMRDPANAARAAVAYMDAVLGSLPTEAAADPQSPRAFEFFAAAYNGGTAKIKRASLVWDDQISGVLKPKEILSRARLHSETIDYVKKLRAVLPMIMGEKSASIVSET